jgi:hypothetical protein
MELKYTIFLYLIFILLIYLYKPQLFILNVEDKKRKSLYLMFLIIVISIIVFYFKILAEWFLHI